MKTPRPGASQQRRGPERPESTADAVAAGAVVSQRAALPIHAGYLPGAIGRITQLHASHYAQQAGFGIAFEAKVAKELADFCTGLVHGRDGLWLAIEDGEIQGSIAIDGSDSAGAGAHLRWFIVDEGARGTGVGTRLLRAALQFCIERPHRRTFLWTFDQLHAARHLYEKHGFVLAETRRGQQWGTEVNEQRFVKCEAT